MPDRNAPGFPNIVLSAGLKLAEGRFTMVRKLGQGGMGVVWLARDERLGIEVALKFLPAEIYNDPVALEDLRREALKSRGLSHPNIIRIHDFHEHTGEPPFISMEYVEGSTLHTLRGQQEERVFGWEFIQPLVRQLCEALDYAHYEKVIHRDLKPANVMLDKRGRVKLADFGIAAAASDSMSRVSLRGNTSGTPGYMSPQQMDGRAPRISDDVYSLGAMIYELLTSKAPFHRGDIAYQAHHLPPDPMEDRLAEFGLTNTIPPDVAALVMACLAKEPEQRPASARAVADWLGITVASSYQIEARKQPPSPEEPLSPRPNQRRWLWPALAAGVVVVAIVAGGAFFLRKKNGPSLPPTSVNHQEPGKENDATSIIGSWISPDKGSQWNFTANGVFSYSRDGQQQTGRWVQEGSKISVDAKSADGKATLVRRFEIMSLTSTEASIAMNGERPYTWKRLSPATQSLNSGLSGASEAGFTSMFNGRDLTGWEGDPRFWSVQDGAITGERPAASKPEKNTFLFWTGGELGDFELRLSCRMSTGNSGVQFRSTQLEGWTANGYQAEVISIPKPPDGKTWLFGSIVEEAAPARPGSGAVLAECGQRVRWDKDGKRVALGSVGKTPEQLFSSYRPFDWNDYTIIARGPHIVLQINGQTTAELTDDDLQHRSLSGLLAFQLHSYGGKPMKVQFKDIRLKRLSDSRPSSKSENSEPSGASEAGLTSMFNGRDLTGWAGMPQYWSVKNGAIVGKSDTSTPNTGNTFLVWQGGQVSDFEFVCKYKLVANNTNKAANSGIQFRAFMVEPARFTLAGYQAELDPGTLRPQNQPDITTVNGSFLTDGKDDRPGKFWIDVGQKVVIQPATADRASVTVTGSLGQAQDFADAYKPDDWNEVKIVAVGNHIQIFINGRQSVDAIDEGNRYTSGLLGLQLNAPQLFKTLYFKDLKLRVLKSDAPSKDAIAADEEPNTLTAEKTQDRDFRLGKAGGIGAALQKSGAQLIITNVFPGSPSAKAKIKAGQIIRSINGEPTTSMTLQNAVELIRGPVGSKLELELTDPDSSDLKKIILTRQVVTIPSMTQQILESNTGVLVIRDFTQQTSGEVYAALGMFVTKKVEGVVLDLRNNNGGFPEAMQEVAGYFLGPKPTLWLKRDSGKTQSEKVRSDKEQVWLGPVIVLVNTYTAGGELVASALQSNKRALVVGQNTGGKALLSEMKEQPEGTSKRVIHGYFFTAKDEPIYKQGIKPDVLLDTTMSPDQALAKAVEILLKENASSTH